MERQAVVLGAAGALWTVALIGAPLALAGPDGDPPCAFEPSGCVPTCRGEPATLVGTAGSDRLVGSDGRDVIQARRGSDGVRAASGNDLVCGGRGNDGLRGQDGDDDLFGGRDGDRGLGGDGERGLQGGPGSDRVVGQGGTDRHFGGPGADRLLGRSGPDALLGDDGDDLCHGGRPKRDYPQRRPFGTSDLADRRSCEEIRSAFEVGLSY